MLLINLVIVGMVLGEFHLICYAAKRFGVQFPCLAAFYIVITTIAIGLLIWLGLSLNDISI